MDPNVEFVKAKIADLKKTLEVYERCLELLERSGTPPTLPKVTPPATTTAEQSRVQPSVLPTVQDAQEIRLQGRSGQRLGVIRIFPDRVEVEPSFALRKSTPPFQSFLVDKVFEEMRRKDEEARDAGTLDPSQVFDWVLVERGEVLERITLRGLKDPSVRERRLREVVSATKWTFERMLERTEQVR